MVEDNCEWKGHIMAIPEACSTPVGGLRYHAWSNWACLAKGFVFGLFGGSVDFFFRLFERCLEVLFRHFDFLLNEIQLGLDGFPQIFRYFLESLKGFSDLPSYLRQLLGAKEEKRNHENDKDFAYSQSEHGVSPVMRGRCGRLPAAPRSA